MKITNIILTLLLAIFTFSSCQDEKKDAPKNNAKKSYGGCFRLSLNEAPSSIYPLNAVDVNSYDIVCQIYEGLVKIDPKSMSIIPALAQKWDISEDGKTYTFYLKKGVYFHDDECFSEGKGREVKASDVLYSFSNVCTNQDANLVFANTFKNRLLGANKYFEASKAGKPSFEMEGLKVIDDYTIKVILETPNFNFLQILSMPSLSILPNEAVTKYNVATYVGTGPFKMAQGNSLRNNKIVLVRNVNYHGTDSLGNKLPFLDSVEFIIANSKRAELDDFKNKKIDIIWGLPSESIKSIVEEKISSFKKDSSYILERNPEMTSQYYLFNLTKKAFKDVRVRQAFNYAIDRNRIIEEILKGEAYGIGENGVTPPSIKGYDITKIKGYSFDIEKAKKLMIEAGYPEGKGFPELHLEINNDGRKNVAIAIEIQKQLLRNIGVKLNFDFVTLSQKLESEYLAKADIYRSGWTADFPSPESFLGLFYGKIVPADINKPSFPNTSRYVNAKYDELFEKAINTKDAKKRYDFFLEAEQLLMNDAPGIVLYYEENYVLVQSYVKDFYCNPLKYKELSIVSLEQ